MFPLNLYFTLVIQLQLEMWELNGSNNLSAVLVP